MYFGSFEPPLEGGFLLVKRLSHGHLKVHKYRCGKGVRIIKKLILGMVFSLLLLAFTAIPAKATTTCSFATVDNIMTLIDNCSTDTTIIIPDGFTLDGAGYTITAYDPPGGHFVGAIVKNGGVVANVGNLTVTTENLINVCDGGDSRLRGIMFDGASGSVTNNSILNINQGASGCQEGNAIEIRNAPFDGTHPNTQNVVVKGNIISNYQKTGIVANGDVSVHVQDNTIAGVGLIPYIAQNGIQFGFGASGIAIKNNVSENYYGGDYWSSTGILVYEASNVKVVNNIVHDNQIGIDVEGIYATNNKIINNRFYGNLEDIYQDAVRTKIHANVTE